MKHLYLAYRSFEPGIAATNRILAYLNSLSEAGIQVTAVFFFPDGKRSKPNVSFKGIDYLYVWERLPWPKNKLGSIIATRLYYIWFRRMLKNGDNVFVYGMVDLIHCLIKKKGINVYDEITEHPVAIGYRNPLTSVSWNKYYKDCNKLRGLFVISNNLKLFFTEKGVDENRIQVVNMVVDPARFSDVEKQPGEKYIAYCGVIYNNKDGVDQLIKSFAKISPAHPDVKLYVIGPIPRSSENNENIALIENLGLVDKVVLTGRVEADRMPQLLMNATILALDRPNNLQAKYGFATKLGEYLLTGNPVVLTDVGDIKMFFKDGENALVAQPDDIDSFASKLCWCLDNPEKARLIGENGKRTAMQFFNARIETNKIIKYIFHE